MYKIKVVERKNNVTERGKYSSKAPEHVLKISI